MIGSPLSKLPVPRVADRGFGNVTICIAALASSGEKIVVATDRKVAFGVFSADSAVQKTEPIIERNMVLIAGNDVARSGTIFNKARTRLRESWSRDANVIAETLFEECNAERDRIIEASVLRKRGFTWEMFRKQGNSLCTEAVYYEIESEIADVRLSLDFLIAGFDETETPHLRYTNWCTPPENYDSLGFYAIGTGANSAIGSLAHAVEYLHFNKRMAVEDVVYHVLAAKFMSESAQDVGRDTFLAVAGKGIPDAKTESERKNIFFLSLFGAIDFIRERWEKEGAPRVPKGITAAIKDLLVSADEIKTSEFDIFERSAKHTPEAKKLMRRFKKAYEAFKSTRSDSQKSEPAQ